ncbi:MAG: SDR family NAD(P)-dependent oxidoreductase [Planctomycetia bacterium]|nr:SDR family NAD(P)-dependent oxidoreductase [Planctomycetia bacterium]
MPTTSIISGGSRGLGLAVVERLLDRGDYVATFSRSGSAALAALASLHADRLLAERIDAADADAIRGFVARVAARFGGVDHCIANAAVAHEGVVATVRDDEIDAMLDVNLRGSIVLVRECVRQMLVRPVGDERAAAGGPSVVVVSSVVASRGDFSRPISRHRSRRQTGPESSAAHRWGDWVCRLMSWERSSF